MRLKLCGALLLFLGSALSELEFWKGGIVYQIYPRSFADSDGDGNGDLKGILNHVDYLKDLGVTVAWLSPIYASPMIDMGYDISDWKDVNPMFGTLDDVKNLIDAFHKKEIKLFMDMVPNHSSHLHKWFNASKYQETNEKDFYIWKQPKGWTGSTPIPPNNWESEFKGSAWEFEPTRGQFYLHQFLKEQPDLNYNNPKVVDAMFDNMKFWLDMGIDGFRMDAVPYLVEDDKFQDEPKKLGCEGDKCLNHIYTQHQPGTYKLLQNWTDRIIDAYGQTKYLFHEAYGNRDQTMKYFYKNSAPFNFIMISNITISTNATELQKEIDLYLNSIPNGGYPNWVIGNHDNSRVGTRMGADFIDAANVLNLLLPGTTITFQGEELGMTDGYVRPSRILDCCERDPERMPMQWNSSEYSGFSSSKNGTWLPLNTNYWAVNAEAEKQNEYSHLSIYTRLAKLKSELAESVETNTSTIGDWVLCFTRSLKKDKYYVIINMNNIEVDVTIKSGFNDIPGTVTVHTPTGNAGFKIGDKIDTSSKITLRPRSAVVVSGSAGIFASLTLMISSLAVILCSRQ